MTDTPRTEQNHIGMGIVPASFAQQLERELNAANEHIKRLEEAGDGMQRWCDDEQASENWSKARIAKP